jgi:predicted dehydrogenase
VVTRRPLRFGVLGAADIAVRKTLPALRTLAGAAELSAVASRDPARAAEVAQIFGGRVHRSYDDLIADPDVDAVYLPLPTGGHAPWASRAIAAGKHVLAEKPLTTGYDATASLLSEAADAGLVLAENMTFPFHGQHTEVLRLVHAGAIGKVRKVTASFAVPPRPDDDIRYRADLGGGSLLDQGVYPVRAALLALGPRLSLRRATLRHDPVRGVDLGGEARLITPDGVEALLTFGMDGAYECHYELTGTTGSLRVERAFTPPPDFRPQVILRPADGPQRLLDLPPDDQFAGCLRAFVARVHAGAGPHPADVASLAQAQIVDRIRRTAGALARV